MADVQTVSADAILEENRRPVYVVQRNGAWIEIGSPQAALDRETVRVFVIRKVREKAFLSIGALVAAIKQGGPEQTEEGRRARNIAALEYMQQHPEEEERIEAAVLSRGLVAPRVQADQEKPLAPGEVYLLDLDPWRDLLVNAISEFSGLGAETAKQVDSFRPESLGAAAPGDGAVLRPASD